jgi:hypothetical protein
LNFRTLEEIGSPRGQRDQAFQRRSEVSLAILVLFNAERDLCLALV